MAKVWADAEWDAAIMHELLGSRGKMCVLGGRAFRHHMIGRIPGHMIRPPGDLDLFTVTSHRKTVTLMLEDLGLVPDREFNLYNGKTRLIYYASDEKVDVFIDEFSMCHKLDLRGRMAFESVTLPIADLILTKLQIFEINEKDLCDLFLILASVSLDEIDTPGHINVRYIAQTLAKDWGLWRTCTQNLEKLQSYVLAKHEVEQDPFRNEVLSKLEVLAREVEVAPKSLAWRMRAMIGDRVKWYELPEEP